MIFFGLGHTRISTMRSAACGAGLVFSVLHVFHLHPRFLLILNEWQIQQRQTNHSLNCPFGKGGGKEGERDSHWKLALMPTLLFAFFMTSFFTPPVHHPIPHPQTPPHPCFCWYPAFRIVSREFILFVVLILIAVVVCEWKWYGCWVGMRNSQCIWLI